MRVRVAEASDVREGRGLRVTLQEEEIALFRVGDTIHAIGNVCAHQHLPVLHRGEVSDCTVQCPMHGWTYDLRSGLSVSGQGRVRSYRVSVEEGSVYVELAEGM
jgi:3-phenylpropionate/trans-cinnamate dioxygenase ferredoxin subunit